MNRLYPIRTTRNSWNIKLFCVHQCNPNCDVIMYNDTDDPNLLVITNNPQYKNGKCELYEKIISTPVRIYSFNPQNPKGELGNLYNYDKIVIPDNIFSVDIFYPLSNIFEVKVYSINGFTLSELINSIKIIYEYIYKEEERTSTPQIYNLKKSCSSCVLSDLEQFTSIIKDEDKLDDCVICYDNFIDDKDGCKLECNHKFHNHCINEWIKSSKTCPVCRFNIFKCENCYGTGIIYYQFTGVVIPLENRGNILNRNSTNGVFGIYGFDLEDLLLTNMFYDRIKKKLFINVVS